MQIFLHLPKGTLIKADKSVKDYDESDNDFFNLQYSSDRYIYKIFDDKAKCLNCPDYETDEYNDSTDDFNINVNGEQVNISSPNIKINKNGISITNDSISNNNDDFNELKINKDGIIIKTE